MQINPYSNYYSIYIITLLDINLLAELDIDKKDIFNYNIFINIILGFSDNNSNRYSDTDSEIFDDKIILLKRIKLLRQLRRTERVLKYYSTNDGNLLLKNIKENLISIVFSNMYLN